MLLLTTTGRKSGEPRTTPMGYTMDGDRMYILAMNGKADAPELVSSLVANPEVTLEVGKETYRARAVVMDDAEGERLLARFADREPRLSCPWPG
jgi:deazaflavin-dependent oxidoreductase (nitroreductase family)